MSNLSDNMASRDHAQAAGSALEAAHTPDAFQVGMTVINRHTRQIGTVLRLPDEHGAMIVRMDVPGLGLWSDNHVSAAFFYPFTPRPKRTAATRVPDLLEAAMIVLARWDDLDDPRGVKATDMNLLRAAIAKATGTESTTEPDAVQQRGGMNP